jgi:hypothetical protein
MLQRRPQFRSPLLWPFLLLFGLAAEVVISLVASWWATRYGVDSLTLGPVLFGVGICCVYLGSQLLGALFAIDTVAGMSLSLLAAMLAWVGVIGAICFLAFLVVLGLYAVIGIPARLLFFTFRPAKKSGRMVAGTL